MEKVKFVKGKFNFGDVSDWDCTKTADIETSVLGAFKSKSFVIGTVTMLVGASVIAVGSYLKGSIDYMDANDKSLDKIGCLHDSQL